MKILKPVKQRGAWVVDLRPEFPGWHYALGPDTLAYEMALHLAYERLFELRSAALAPPTPPDPGVTFVPPPSAPDTLTEVIDLWLPFHGSQSTVPGHAWAVEHAKQVKEEIGGTLLAAFCRSGGEGLIRDYVDRLHTGAFDGFKYSAKTIRNRMSVLRQALAFCTMDERGWLPYVPTFPTGGAALEASEVIYEWVREESFRAMRAQIFAGYSPKRLTGLLRAEGIDMSADLYVERRKIYLSWLFYTGVRTHDANKLVGADIGIDIGIYVRRARKTKAAPLQFEMPTPLVDDLRAYLRFVGREAPLPREPIGGGPWSTVGRQMLKAATRVGLAQHFWNPRLMRRSYANKMFDLGYSEKQVADRMGHVDLKMLHEIYVQVPRPQGKARSRWPRFVEPIAPAKFGTAGRAPLLSLMDGGLDDDSSDGEAGGA